MSCDTNVDFRDSIEACRTCGIYFMTSSNFLRQIFTSAVDDPEMMHIRMELSTWKLEIRENDGFPQYICTGCIYEFQKVFKFRHSCLELQEKLRHFYNVLQPIKIKTEICAEPAENMCDFIYVDDISDSEYDGTTPFKVNHLPIKEEIIEEAAIPTEAEAAQQMRDTAKNSSIKSEDTTSEATNESANISDMSVTTTTTTTTQNESLTTTAVSDNEVNTSAMLQHVSLNCSMCQCSFADEDQHKQHMRHVHDIKEVDCHICGKSFKNSAVARLRFHLKWHKLSKHRKCAQCGFYCNSNEVLKEHTREMHSKVQCSVCSKFLIAKRLKAHMRAHDTDTAFQCTRCSQVFNTSKEIKEHIRLMHFNAEPILSTVTDAELTCLLCELKFMQQDDLTLHMQQHHNADELLYAAENAFPESESSLVSDKHVEEISSETRTLFESFSLSEQTPAPAVYCAACDTECADMDELQRHTLVCEQKCNVNQLFKVEEKYDKDAATVDDYSQHIYGTGTVQAQAEEEHHPTEQQVAHDDDDDVNTNYEMMHNFGCAQCTDTFATVEQLRAHHEQMHSQKPNFKCDICGKTFKIKFSLNRHLNKHKST